MTTKPLNLFFNHSGFIITLPCNLQKKESIPTVTYKPGYNKRNKILNYKDVVNSIYVDKEVLFSLKTNLRDCEKSIFCDPHHIHITTGDLRIIENKKLGKHYREPRSKNFRRAYCEIALRFVHVIIYVYNL